MRNKHRIASIVIGVCTAVLTASLGLNYWNIASEGLTLSSIVLAVYVAAIIGLINTPLSEKLSTTVSKVQPENTQMGELTGYFKRGALFAIATIIISSIILLVDSDVYARLNSLLNTNNIQWLILVKRFVSTLGCVMFAENLLFLGIILQFMLNRQIWNKQIFHVSIVL